MSWGKTFLNLSRKFVSVANPNKSHRILPQMSHITKKLYSAKKTNVKNDTSIFHLTRRFPAINNVWQWNATLKMYQSDQDFLCCRHSYLRLFLFYVHRFIHFPSISFLRHFYHQDAKYDMFLSPKINKFFTRLIFACLYFPVVEIWFIRLDGLVLFCIIMRLRSACSANIQLFS